MCIYIYICMLDLTPSQGASHHQDYFPFLVGNPDKPLFATGILGGGETAKTHVEAENDSLQKESPLPGINFQVPCRYNVCMHIFPGLAREPESMQYVFDYSNYWKIT